MDPRSRVVGSGFHDSFTSGDELNGIKSRLTSVLLYLSADNGKLLPIYFAE